jgi:hypothetical protein
MTRAIGLAHFSIGWLFTFTSPRLHSRAGIGRLTFWTAFGIAFCAIFYWFGADRNPLCLMAFYGFFFIHGALDEGDLFRRSGECPTHGPETDRFVRSLAWSMALTSMTLLAAAQVWRGHFLGRSAPIQNLSIDWLLAGLALAATLVLACWVQTARLARRAHGSIGEAMALYQPLLAVYIGLIVTLLLGSVVGSIGANLVIMLHGMTWLVYTTRQLSERNAPATGVWSWLRGTPAGFLTLHVIVIALSLTLFALRTHAWQRTGIVCDLVSKSWFPYWGIMHIATAFWRSK